MRSRILQYNLYIELLYSLTRALPVSIYRASYTSYSVYPLLNSMFIQLTYGKKIRLRLNVFATVSSLNIFVTVTLTDIFLRYPDVTNPTWIPVPQLERQDDPHIPSASKPHLVAQYGHSGGIRLDRCLTGQPQRLPWTY